MYGAKPMLDAMGAALLALLSATSAHAVQVCGQAARWGKP